MKRIFSFSYYLKVQDSRFGYKIIKYNALWVNKKIVVLNVYQYTVVFANK